MRALTEKQRAYVLAMLSDPLATPTDWARAAGYDDTNNGAKVQGHYLSHNPRVAAAVQEVARLTANTLGPLLGLAVAMQIAKRPGHPKQLQAAVALMDRAGLPATTHHEVGVIHTDATGEAMLERIRALAAGLGMDPAGLIGANAEPKLIEGKVDGQTIAVRGESHEKSEAKGDNTG